MASDPEHWTDAADRSVARGRSTGYPVGDFVVRTWRCLEYSSLYLGLVAATEVLVVTFLLSLPLSPAPVVVALVTFAVYANDRLVDLETDDVSNPRRTAFVRRHREVLYVAAAIAYGVGAALSALGGPLAFGLALLPGAVWFVYAVDWIPVPSADVSRLKEVPVVSSVLVAVAWSLAVVMLPLAFANAPLTPAAGLTLLYFALAAFVSVQVANVHDIPGDVDNGIVTLPTVLGVDRIRTVLYAITLGTGAMLAVAAVRGLYTVTAAAVLSLGVLGLAVVVAGLGRTGRGTTLTLAAECTRIPVFAAFAVLTYL